MFSHVTRKYNIIQTSTKKSISKLRMGRKWLIKLRSSRLKDIRSIEFNNLLRLIEIGLEFYTPFYNRSPEICNVPKKSWRCFDVKRQIISQNISRSHHICFLKYFSLLCFRTEGHTRTSPDFFFAEIMSDNVILGHKSHIWCILKIFISCDFFTFSRFLLKIAKNHKKLKFSKYTKYKFLLCKITLSDIISTKNGEV